MVVSLAGQAVWPACWLRVARRAASTATPATRARTAARTARAMTSQAGCPLGSAGTAGAEVSPSPQVL